MIECTWDICRLGCKAVGQDPHPCRVSVTGEGITVWDGSSDVSPRFWCRHCILAVHFGDLGRRAIATKTQAVPVGAVQRRPSVHVVVLQFAAEWKELRLLRFTLPTHEAAVALTMAIRNTFRLEHVPDRVRRRAGAPAAPKHC